MKNAFLILVLLFCHITSPTAATVMKLNATYTIPTENEEDFKFSTYNLDNYLVIISTVNGIEETVVKYDLPETMLGVPQEITMKLIFETDGTKFLEGTNSIAFCNGKWVSMKCDVRFFDISVNLEKIQEKLEEKNVSAIEISKRLSILSKFSGDPIGISQVIPQ